MSQIEKQIANVLYDSNGTSSGASDCYKIALEHMGKFTEWLQLNRWFFYDQSEKKWHYTFEGGTAMSNASYEKNYKKTTDELITLYIESIELNIAIEK